MIRITSKRLFRRADMAHPKGPTDYPNDRFTKEQIKILKAEPMLKVEFIPDEKPRKNKGGDK